MSLSRIWILSLTLGSIFAQLGWAADCETAYTAYIKSLDAQLAALKPAHDQQERASLTTAGGAFLAGGAIGVALAPATAGASLEAWSYGAIGAGGGLSTVAKLTEDKADPAYGKTRQLKAAMETAYDLLREASVGQGPKLELAMKQVWSEVGPSASISDLAKAVTILSGKGAFCEAEPFSSASEIVSRSVQLLARP